MRANVFQNGGRMLYRSRHLVCSDTSQHRHAAHATTVARVTHGYNLCPVARAQTMFVKIVQRLWRLFCKSCRHLALLISDSLESKAHWESEPTKVAHMII